MIKRKDGRYQEAVSVEVNGRPKRVYFYGKTQSEVLRKMQAFKGVQEKGRTFSAVADEWREDTQSRISPNTAKSYRPAMLRAVASLGERRVREMRPVDVSRFLSSFVTQYRPSAKTARNQLSVVSQIFAYAVRNGDCDANITRDITIPKGLKTTKRSTPSDDDVEHIKHSIDCTFGLFAFFAMYTGLRRGEILALDWDDIDMENRIINVSKSVYYINTKPHIKQPKTEAGVRAVPIPDALLAVLRPSKGLLFPYRGDLMPEYAFRRLWDRYCEESGVGCTPHQLRHLYATALFEAGIDELDAQELMGHADIQTTHGIYTHIRNNRRIATADKVRKMVL